MDCAGCRAHRQCVLCVDSGGWGYGGGCGGGGLGLLGGYGGYGYGYPGQTRSSGAATQHHCPAASLSRASVFTLSTLSRLCFGCPGYYAPPTVIVQQQAAPAAMHMAAQPASSSAAQDAHHARVPPAIPTRSELACTSTAMGWIQTSCSTCGSIKEPIRGAEFLAPCAPQAVP